MGAPHWPAAAARPRRRPPPPRAAQRGVSLTELMVGTAVGLFVVAAAAMLVATQLSEHRHLLLETQVQQDLRVAADIVTRELRRAGHWSAAASAVATPGAAAAVNPYATVSPETTTSSQVDFGYWRRDTDTGPYGFKLDGRVLKTRLAAGGWQELTDVNVLRITGFTVTPRHPPALRLPCPDLCPDGTTDCWPTIAVREFVVEISGEAAADPAVRRTLRTVVRPRTDLVRLSAPGASACPA